MNNIELKELYAKEPWGNLLFEMGMEPYDTESSARRVAEYAATKIDELKRQNQIYITRESIIEVWFFNDECYKVGKNSVTKIEMANTFHGDHYENWLVVHCGNTIRTLNPRHVKEIISVV